MLLLTNGVLNDIYANIDLLSFFMSKNSEEICNFWNFNLKCTRLLWYKNLVWITKNYIIIELYSFLGLDESNYKNPHIHMSFDVVNCIFLKAQNNAGSQFRKKAFEIYCF